MRTEDDIRAAFRALARQAPEADSVLTAVREQLGKVSAGKRQGGPSSARRWMPPARGRCCRGRDDSRRGCHR